MPARLKEVMANGAMYPQCWTFRAFHQVHCRQNQAVEAPLFREAVQPAVTAGPPEGPALTYSPFKSILKQ